MSKFTENLLLVMALAYFVWLWMRRNNSTLSMYAATANNTAPFWFTAPQNPQATSFDFASQTNY